MGIRYLRYPGLFGILLFTWSFGLPGMTAGASLNPDASAGRDAPTEQRRLKIPPVMRLPVQPLSRPPLQRRRARAHPASPVPGFGVSSKFELLLYTLAVSLALGALSAGGYAVWRGRALRRPVPRAYTNAAEEEIVPGILMHRRNGAPAWSGEGPAEGDRPASSSVPVSRREADSPVPATAQPVPIPEIASASPVSVRNLAHQGWSIQDIARELGWGQSEVALALRFEHKRSK